MGLLDFFKKRLAPAPEEKKEEVIIASPIDYSAVPAGAASHHGG